MTSKTRSGAIEANKRRDQADKAAQDRVKASRLRLAVLEANDRARTANADAMTPLDHRALKTVDLLGDGTLISEVGSGGGQVPDSEGLIGNPAARSNDLISAMARNQTIDTNMEHAARRFQRDFHVARLDPAGPPSIERLAGSYRDQPLSQSRAEAQDNIYAAITALGGHGAPAAEIVWHVIGNDMGIRDFLARHYTRTTRKASPDWVRGVLVSALGVLWPHYERRDKLEASMGRERSIQGE